MLTSCARALAAAALLTGAAAPAWSQTPLATDEAAIRAMAETFARGFYARDRDQVLSVVHPALSKLGVDRDYWGSGRDVVRQLPPGMLQLLGEIYNRDGRLDPATSTVEVRTLDQSASAGVVHLIADTDWYDIFLAARLNGEWVFVNCAYGGYSQLEADDPDAEMAAIADAAHRYIDAIYANDAAGLRQAAWWDLERREVTGPDGDQVLSLGSLETLDREMRDLEDSGALAGADPARVTPLAVTAVTGAVRIDAARWTEWVFLLRLDGDWRIVNSFVDRLS